MSKAVLLLSMVAAVFLCCSGRSFNTEVQRVTSPDKKTDVVVFVRQGGATTGFSTQISLERAGKALPDGPGNIFVADDDHGKVALLADGTIPLALSWRTNTVLEIQFSKRARVFKMQDKWRGVQIIYTPSLPELPGGTGE
jgi:hypothetical protein